MYELVLIFAVSFVTTFLVTPWLIPKLKEAGLTGRDVNKPDKPEVAEMGGFAVVFGLTSGVLLAIALSTFFGIFNGTFHVNFLLAAFSTILLMSFIGIFDDLFDMRQTVKAVLPLFAALPLVAVKAGASMMVIPFIGEVHFGILYTLVIIPLGVAGASNATNMLAGFNGMEAGMGAVACLSLAVIAVTIGSIESAVILVAMLGALVAFLRYNWYPSKILIGDIGTLSIGAVLASSVIIGNFESAGVILIVPYFLDFLIKAKNGFPSRNWWGDYGLGKLLCTHKPISLCQNVMKYTGGLTERNLVLLMIFFEAAMGLVAIAVFLFR